jgi:hypothetical protein
MISGPRSRLPLPQGCRVREVKKKNNKAATVSRISSQKKEAKKKAKERKVANIATIPCRI